MTVNDSKWQYLPLSAIICQTAKKMSYLCIRKRTHRYLVHKTNLKTLMSNPQKPTITLWELSTTIPPGEKSSTSSSPSSPPWPPPLVHRAVCKELITKKERNYQSAIPLQKKYCWGIAVLTTTSFSKGKEYYFTKQGLGDFFFFFLFFVSI